MKQMLKDWGAALAVGVLVYVLAGWMFAPTQLDGLAPDFTLTRADGGSLQLASLRGKVTVVNFWGSWCGPCREEIPDFARFAKAHPEVQLVGVAVRSGSGEALQRSAEGLGITWPVVESTPEVLDTYGVSVFPTTYVLRADGSIAESFVGVIDEKRLARAVEEAT